MRAIHKRSDGRFLRSVAALLFLAVCAWCWAGLCARFRTGGLPVSAAKSAPVTTLAGICLRREAPLYLPETAALAVQPGERIPAGGLLARRADGGELRSACSALYLPDVDGWTALAPDPEELDAAALRELLEQEPPSPTGCRGRLVYRSVWFFAALAPAGLPTPEPGACRLRFAGTPDWLPARLLAPRETPGSQSVLLFRLSRGGDYLSLRRCEAELYNPS